MEFSLPKFGNHDYQTIDHKWQETGSKEKENFDNDPYMKFVHNSVKKYVPVN